MYAHEARAGRTFVAPGETAWLPVADWHETTVVAIEGRTVRILALWAREPGRGAFRRLVAAILAHGLKPVAVEPPLELEAVLDRWGWQRHELGEALEKEVVWQPGCGQQE